jgi:hypothetical protein
VRLRAHLLGSQRRWPHRRAGGEPRRYLLERIELIGVGGEQRQRKRCGGSEKSETSQRGHSHQHSPSPINVRRQQSVDIDDEPGRCDSRPKGLLLLQSAIF